MFRRSVGPSSPRPEEEETRAGGRRLDLAQLRRLWRLTHGYRALVFTGLLATAVAGLLQLALPLLARELFNDAFAAGADGAGPGARTGLHRLTLVLLGVFAVQAGFNYLRVWTLGIVGEGVVADLRKRVFGHVLELSPAFFQRRKTGEITSRLTSDVATIQQVVSTALAQFMSQFVTLFGGAAALLVINARLTLVMLAILPPVIIGGAVFGRRLRALSSGFQDRVADANADAEEAIANVRVVKSFTGEDLERRRYAGGIDASYHLARRRVRLRAVFVPAVILAMFAGITLVLWYGGQQVLSGALAPGDLIAFLLLTLFVAGSVATFTGLYAQLQQGIGASRRVFELLDERPDLPVADPPVPLPRDRGEVRIDHVWFRYPSEADAGSAPPAERSAGAPNHHEADDWVLRDVDLTLHEGDVVALVGPSGAGKSTLASLLPRFFDPQHGAIRLGGVDLRDADPISVRRAIGMVPQETQLFSGTVAENVRYGRPDASMEQVREAARAAHADRFVQELPQGYDTRVGERGLRLSGGQRQRIAIARALLKDPDVLVLDEATSNLDSESEALVQAALDHLMRGRTSLVIAHRLSTVVGADRIVVLVGGRVVQVGRHDTLVATDGPYRQLFETQFARTAPADGRGAMDRGPTA